MINLIGKGASLVLQIALVVAAVLLFSYFDPFGLLAPKKKTLKNTPVQVRSIKEIGQLITAEYYGEVIASLDEVVKTNQYTLITEFRTVTDDLHLEFIAAVDTMSKQDLPKSRSKIYAAFVKDYPDLVKDELFDSYLYYINEKLKDRNYKLKELDKELADGEKSRLIKRLCLNIGGDQDKLKEISTTEFQSKKEEQISGVDKKKYRRSRLVIIGRGGVKAGFDFGNFSERNFRYNPSRRTIHFIGLQPQILSATINPWFIPEEKVEGFEFLIAERGARLKPEYTKLVKQRCLDKLKYQAEEKEILKRAQENAETNLKAFFSLLLNDEVKNVIFHNDELDYTLDALIADSVIRNEEVVTIDHTMLGYSKSNKKNKKRFHNLNAFIDSLKQEKFVINDSIFNLHSYSSLLFYIVRNRMIDSADMVRIKERKNVLLDSVWQSKLFVDMNLKTRLDSAQKAAQFRDSLNADLQRLYNDLDNSFSYFEMEFDTTYFKKKETNAVRMKNIQLKIDSTLKR